MADAAIGGALVQSVGHALIAFVWQGAIAGCVIAACLIAARAASPQTRYAIGVVGLGVMALLPAIGVARAWPATSPSGRDVGGSPGLTALSISAPVQSADAAPGTSLGTSASFDPVPLVVLLWAVGVLTLLLQLFRSWRHVRRLSREGTAVDIVLADRALALAQRLAITRPVRLVESTLAALPAVIGWLRPAIVLPTSALAGLSPAQLDAILAHELAHIRRGDYLVNAVQCVVETLLFYHPAVWWVSRRIRVERELCCDDVAAGLCGDALLYARALTSLEELRARAPMLAISAHGGDLLLRIRRLIEPVPPSGPRWSGGFAMSVVMTVVAIALSGSLHSAAPFEDTPGPPQARSSVGILVLDPHGGVVPGATVQLGLPDGSTKVAISDSRGEAHLADVPAGVYEARVSISGFRTARARVEVIAGQPRRGAVRLEVGALVETVQVHAPGVAAPPGRPAAAAAGSADLLTVAREHYIAGRLDEAERAATQALERLRSERAATVATRSDRAANAVAASPQRPADSSRDVQALEPAPEFTGPLRVGGDIKEPRQLSAAAPVYPPIAVSARVQGVVIIEATVDRNGLVNNARVLRSQPLLDMAALDAVRQWRYSPTLLNGVPVPVTMTATVSFSIR